MSSHATTPGQSARPAPPHSTLATALDRISYWMRRELVEARSQLVEARADLEKARATFGVVTVGVDR